LGAIFISIFHLAWGLAVTHVSFGGFVEKQLEIRSPAWSGKTTDGIASPLHCHKKAKEMSYEDVSYTTFY
jgi:hypothetical protein